MSVPKSAQPVLGFNHNLKFGPRVYHVQTEDSGLPHAHYITHLFVGGNILASMKSSYADRATEHDLAKTVRSLMEAQHKQMVKRLVAGEFNDRAQLFSASYEPGVLATGQHGPAAMNQARSEPASASSMSNQPLTTPHGGSPRVPAPPPPVRAPPQQIGQPHAARPASQPTAHNAAPPAAAPHSLAPPVARPAPPNLSRPPPPNLSRPATPPRPPPTAAALPQAPKPTPLNPAGAAQAPSVSRQPAPLPSARLPGAPLPSTTRAPPQQRTAPPPMVPMVAPIARQPQAPPSRNPFAADAFPAERPLEVPVEGLPTLFAEELISEKSLDEVILAFLSADLEQGK